MRLDMNTVQTIQVNPPSLHKDFDPTLFENITWSMTPFHTHQEISATLDGKNPYTITILIDSLKYELRNKKEYVKKTKSPRVSKYRELLYTLFFEKFGQTEGNELYAKWLDAYHTLWQKTPAHESIDDYIITRELEPRYKQKILARFTNHERLFAPRIETTRERYYRLPKPLDYVDWRTPYDNLFIWEENGQKQARRGGSGSSGARETNSIFILGLLELNKHAPVPSFLFVYTEKNELQFLKKFDRLCVPSRDIGSNYPTCTNKRINALKQGGLFMQWDPWHTQRIEIIQYD